MRIAVSRAPAAERDVSPLELSHHLLGHLDLRTAAETAILALAVFYG